MGFSSEWEIEYANNHQMSIWPWSDLISLFYRYSNKEKVDSVLEIGCGAGANIPFFKALNINYYAVEGSKTIVQNLHERFPEYKENIICCDFTEMIPFDKKFDLIFDRAAITHNTTADIKKVIKLIETRIDETGKFIGVDWFSDKHSDYNLGYNVEDKYTKKNAGYFNDLGNTHFSDDNHLKELWNNFTFEYLAEKITTQVVPEKQVLASWDFVVKKKI